jgi:predicted nucleic acid-binding Zn finger protein
MRIQRLFFFNFLVTFLIVATKYLERRYLVKKGFISAHILMRFYLSNKGKYDCRQLHGLCGSRNILL